MCLRISPIRSPRQYLLRATAAAALVATVTVTGAGMASAAVIGPDVSSNNHGNGSTLDWGAMHHIGQASFVFIKATEGGGYTNPAFASDFAAAGQNGLARGAYHFARPSGGTQAEISVNAVAEASQFGHAVGTLAGPGNLPPVLDLEDAGTLNSDQLSLWTHIWLDQATKLTGRTPILYTNPGFWKQSMGNSGSFTSYPLWLAHYKVPTPELVGGWKTFAFWQFTDSARIAGASSSLDMSLFNGSAADLAAMTVSPAAAAASAAAAAAASAAAATMAATTATRVHTMLGTKLPVGTRTDMTSSRSDLRSWLSVLGVDGSPMILGH